MDGNQVEQSSNHAVALALMNMMDVDRIEVIKGAGSILYDTGALGGAVNIFAKCFISR